jgi:hypothetical protein
MLQIPPATAPLWDKLVTGQVTHKFNLFAANLAVARAVRLVAGTPASKPAMVADLRQFFEKFANPDGG